MPRRARISLAVKGSQKSEGREAYRHYKESRRKGKPSQELSAFGDALRQALQKPKQ